MAEAVNRWWGRRPALSRSSSWHEGAHVSRQINFRGTWTQEDDVRPGAPGHSALFWRTTPAMQRRGRRWTSTAMLCLEVATWYLRLAALLWGWRWHVEEVIMELDAIAAVVTRTASSMVSIGVVGFGESRSVHGWTGSGSLNSSTYTTDMKTTPSGDRRLHLHHFWHCRCWKFAHL
jgi:hypothetical protein